VFLKISGEIVGWGMHFQNPYFLELTTFILFALILYSFEILSFFPSVRIKNGKYQNFWGNFISSMIASVVAIPCTAPFLGTAATFAIQGSISDLCWIFLAIATGFSIPYFISLITPVDFFIKFSYGNFLKKIINLGVMVTFLWVFWLLSNYLSIMAVVTYVFSFIILTLLLGKRKYFMAALAGGICFCCWMCRDLIVEATDSYKDLVTNVMPKLASEQVVIFNITAEWCLTCKYNGRIFRDQEIIESMKNNNVKFIEADMTKKNNTLMQFIKDHNRVGIPFTIVFGPHAKNGIIVDEILTTNTILRAIRDAK
jgi:suppressor for copper-sensitivity B